MSRVKILDTSLGVAIFPSQRSSFSKPALLWSRPKETQVVESRVFAAFTDNLAADLDLVDRAEPVTDSAKLDSILPAQPPICGTVPKKTRPAECLSGSAARNRLSEYIHEFLLDWEQKLPQLVSNKN